MTTVYNSLHRNFFAPSLPRRSRFSARPREESFLSSTLPQANFLGFAMMRPESTQAVRPTNSGNAIGNWLKERARWKSLQKTGFEGMVSPIEGVTPDPAGLGSSSPALNLVELSLATETPVIPVKKDSSPDTVKGKITPMLEYTQPELELSYGYLRPKSQKFTKFLKKQPMSRLQYSRETSRASSLAGERTYQDTNSKKIYAQVVLPGPIATASASSSRQGTAHLTHRPKPSIRGGGATMTPHPPSTRSHTIQTKVTRTRHYLQPRSSPHTPHEGLRPFKDSRQLPQSCESPAHSSRNPTPILESRYHNTRSRQGEDPTPLQYETNLVAWDFLRT